MEGAEERVQKLAQPLGQIIIEFNFLEVQLSFALAGIASEDVTGGERLSFSKKLKLLEQVAKRHFDAEMLRDTLSVTAILRELNLQRNMYIHSEYFAEYNDVNDFLGLRQREIRHFDKDLFSEGVLRTISRAELEDFISRLRHAAAALGEILKRLAPSSVGLGEPLS
jgi:hypothetical protein